MEQDEVGSFDFISLKPVEESKQTSNNLLLETFTDSDFDTSGCEEIPSIILEEAKHFVTFMSSMVEELLGNEEFMLAVLKTREQEFVEIIEEEEVILKKSDK